MRDRTAKNLSSLHTILYRITDANGAATDVEAQVYVPHDQGKGMIPSAGDDGYTVTPECALVHVTIR